MDDNNNDDDINNNDKIIHEMNHILNCGYEIK